MKRWRPWLFVIAVAALIQVAVVAMLTSDPEPVVGHWQPTAPVALASLPPLRSNHGNEVLGDGPAIVYFWATWCEPCVRHLPETLALATSGETPVWLVSRDESWEAVVGYFKGKVPAEVVYDAGFGDALGVSVLPTSFYVDEGQVRARSLDALSRGLILRARE